VQALTREHTGAIIQQDWCLVVKGRRLVRMSVAYTGSGIYPLMFDSENFSRKRKINSHAGDTIALPLRAVRLGGIHSLGATLLDCASTPARRTSRP
jgi:hypothetical protein